MAKKSGGGCLRALATTLVILVALAVGLDRGANWAVERVAARQLQSEFALTAEPGVRIHGLPFVTQVVDHKLGRVDVDAAGLKLDAHRQGRAKSLKLTLDGVNLTPDYSIDTVDRVNARAVLDWSQASTLLGHEMRYVGQKNGRGAVEVDSTADLGGQQISFKVVAVPVIDPANQHFKLEDATVDLSGYQLPAHAERELTRAATQPVPLQMQRGLVVTGMEATNDGLQVDLSGGAIKLGG